MFYSYNALSKKGPLASIWLAAHWERKLSKAAICGVNVKDAVDEVKRPTQELAFRTTGHLLLGIVRIYAKKTSYLFSDAHDIVLRLKAAFTSNGEKLLLEEDDEIPRDPTPQRGLAIDFEIVDYDEDATIGRSRTTDITINEEDIFDFDDRSERSAVSVQSFNDPVQMFSDPGFELTFSGDRLARAGSLFGNEIATPKEIEGPRAGTTSYISTGLPASFDEPLLTSHVGEENLPGYSAVDGAEPIAVDMENQDKPTEQPLPESRLAFGDITNATPLSLLSDTRIWGPDEQEAGLPAADNVEPMDIDQAQPAGGPDVSSFVAPNEAPESFILEPLNISELPVRHRARRHRNLLVDRESKLNDQAIRDQVSDYQDLLRPALDIAPPSRRIMFIKEMGSMEQLMSNPGNQWLFGTRLRNIYSSQMELGLRPTDSDETLLSGHLREDLEMAQVVLEPSRPVTPVQSEIDVTAMTPAIPEIVEQPSELLPPEYARRRTATPAAGVEMFGDRTPSPLHLEDQPKTPPGPFGELDHGLPTPGEPSELRDDSGQLLAPLDDTRMAHERRKKDITLISVAEKKELLDYISEGLSTSNEVTFSSFVTPDHSRKTAARRFFAVLEARKNREIKLRQEEPFGEIYIERDINLPTSTSV